MIDIDRVPPELAERYRRAGYYRGELLSDLLRPWAARDPTRIAVVYGDRRLSFGELDAKADRLASGLYEAGLRRGDRVVVQLPNIDAFPLVVIALFRLGALPVFALPNHRRKEVVYLCEYSEAAAYIVPDTFLGFDYRALAREVLQDTRARPRVIVAGDGAEFTSLDELDCAPRPLAASVPSDVAFFLLSGGTTGLPKLIPRTHDDYAYQLRATAEGLAFDEHGVYLAALPIAHNAALGCPGLLGALRAGGKTVLLASPSPEEAFPAIQREGVTLTTLMPPLVQLWLASAPDLKADLSGMLLQVGSQRFAPELARRVQRELRCRLTQWFGMAEGLLTFTRLDDPREVVEHTQGRALCPDDEIRVVGPDARDVAPGQVGELLTRGPYTLRGYYNAAEYNARTFTCDGFLKTGDLVRITPDGNMVVEGRIKDVINRGGEKVSAGEVEDLLLEHLLVREVALVAMPDPILGERVAAFIVPAEHAPSLKELRTFLRQRGLADYKIPERMELVDRLPQTNVGKVDKAQLRELFCARGAP